MGEPLFDSHTHFPLPVNANADTSTGADASVSPPSSANASTIDILQNARKAGLCGLLAVGGDATANDAAIQAARLAPSFARLAIGLCPDEAESIDSPAVLALRIDALQAQIESLEHEGLQIAAIGEIGLDFYHNDTPELRARQIALFAAQLDLAAERNLPCSIHSRAADVDTVKTLREHLGRDLMRDIRAGSLHCFVGEADFAQTLLPLGLCFGISGILTFRNAEPLRKIVSSLPPERLLLETDSPYLAPVPMRGKQNEPGFLPYTATCLDSLFPAANIAALTTGTALRIFR
ncbi:MAG: TatD family hydrolase [Kiritimatiellia bacterium]